MSNKYYLAGLLCALLFTVPPDLTLAQTVDPASSQPPRAAPGFDSLYFPEVGHFIGGSFRSFWQSHGGLAQFGFPLTAEFSEQNPTDGQYYTVQYFERERFEYHPELAGTPYEVELGLLGVQLTAQRLLDTVAPFISNAQRLYFPETQHSLKASFKLYWQNQGGLAIYGYPISEEIQEGGFTVQYFERARFEYHPENQPPYDVLLGLLGTQTLVLQGHSLPQIFRLNYSPDSVIQGHASAISLNGPSMYGRSISGSLNGAPLNFQVPDNRAMAFAGVASDAPLRPQSLRVEVTDDSGTLRRFDQSLGVIAGSFEQQSITIDPAVQARAGTPAEVAQETNRDFGFYNQYTPQKFWNGRFSWPCYGPITTSFGTRRTYSDGSTENHDGIDIAVDYLTPIRAAAPGRVVLSEFQKARGNITIIDHGLGLHTAYFHQAQLLVKVGDMVNQGDIIGRAGTTGLSTGVHLHWEMRLNGIGIDPQEWLNRNFQ